MTHLRRDGAPCLQRLAGWLAVLALCAACGSGGDEGTDGAAVRPAPLADQAGAVCGMLVREQPAPRAQVVHGDGARAFLCSIGDLLVHLDAPSPHGREEAVFVEVLDPAEAPGAIGDAPRPWLRAVEAAYVVGVERTGIMGEPVLVYADMATAREVASRHPGARALDLEALTAWWSERHR